MQTYRLRVELQTPLTVRSSRSASARSQVPSHVPAPTLRGALAACMMQAGAGDDTMDQLFGPGGLRTTRMMPAAAHRHPSLSSAPGETLPAPLTLRSCKRYGGFEGEPVASALALQEEAHGAEDMLIALLAFAELGDATLLQAVQRCGDCGNVLTPLGGHIYRRDKQYRTEDDVPKTSAVHVGRDRRRRGAAQGVLYATQMIAEARDPGAPVIMEARVSGPEAALQTLAEEAEAGEVLTVGGSISRGLGRCQITEFVPAAGRAPVAERVEAFQAAVREQAPALAEGRVLVPITLQTPAFFVDAWLRPHLRPHPEDYLQDAAASEVGHAEALHALTPVHQVARTARLQAWNGQAGFPHPTDQGLASGSVIIAAADASGALAEELYAALAHLETAGIGLRRELGYGQVRIADPIHASVFEQSRRRPTAQAR